MWSELDEDIAAEFSQEVFDADIYLRFGGGFHVLHRKGRKVAKENAKQTAQAKYRASLLTDSEKRERRLAQKRAVAKAAYHRKAAACSS